MRCVIIPAQFWQNRPDALSVVLNDESLGADLCACVWRFLNRQDKPPKKMLVLVINTWPEHPGEPELFVAEEV